VAFFVLTNSLINAFCLYVRLFDIKL
jgi:hypothetical protein